MYSSKKLTLIISLFLAGGLILFAEFFEVSGTVMNIYCAIAAVVILPIFKSGEEHCNMISWFLPRKIK